LGENAQTELPWGEVPVLLALARGKSFAVAAQMLGIDRTTVARRLERLEAQLDTQLFDRVAGGLSLTQHGRRILAVSERAEQELSHIQTNCEERRIKYGKVRISVSEHVLSAFAPQLNAFMNDHPDLFLELTTSNRLVDLAKYEADVVLRIGKRPTATLHTRDLGEVRFAYYRRQDETGPILTFWPRAGETEVPAQLLKDHPDAKVVAAIDGVLPTRDMILAGGGAGALPHFLGGSDDRLIPCSEDILPDTFRLFMGCLPEQRNLQRIQIVMKHLSKSLSQSLQSYAIDA